MKFRYRFMTYLSQSPKMSFSMAGEDSITYHLVKHRAQKKQVGIVNIGAAHPVLLNDTFSLTRKLRRENRLKFSVSVDPRPDLEWLWKIFRPKDIFINALVSNNSKVDFYFNQFDSHNSSSNLDWAIGLSKFGKDKSRIKTLSPSITSLMEIYATKTSLIESASESIYSILFIDVEGFELDVLMTNDWESHRPNLILIEICFPSENGLLDFSLDKLNESATHKYLLEKKYSYYGGNGFTQFYLKND